MLGLRRIEELKVWEGSGKDLNCHRSQETVQNVNPTSFLPKSGQHIRLKACTAMIEGGRFPYNNHNPII